MGKSWEIDEKNLSSSKKCLCGQGTIEYYEVKYSHTKVLRSKTEGETKINCANPECPSKKPLSREDLEKNFNSVMEYLKTRM